MWKQLLTVALVFGFATPLAAAGSKSLVPVPTPELSIVKQQDKCKEGEKWDETQKKCVKQEG